MTAVRKKLCCCTQTTECRETLPCKVYDFTFCLGEDDGGCAEPPTYQLTVGPGSTAVVSLTIRYAAQDLRVYGVSGESYAPVDPGAFPDDPFADDCEWSHPFTDAIPSEVWCRGRKICKTLVSFEGVQFTWAFNETTCTWGWFAFGVPVEVGKASAIVETGTPATAGTMHLRQEFDDTETVTVDMFLGLPDAIDWCPGAEDSNLLLTFSIERSDGADFDQMFHDDWDPDVDDGIVGSTPHPDYLPFPTQCDIYGAPCDPFAWPDTMATPSDLGVSATLLPVGRYQGVGGTVDSLTVPTQIHDEVTTMGADPYIGVARATGSWEHRAGSMAVTVINRECLPPPPSCAVCGAENADPDTNTFNGVPFACTGLTWETRAETFHERFNVYAWRLNSGPGPWQLAIASDHQLTIDTYQLRLHCDDVAGTPRLRMHLWHRQTVRKVAHHHTNPPPPQDAEDVYVDTDTGWVDSGVTSVPFLDAIFDGCEVGWEVPDDWSVPSDADPETCVVSSGEFCCDTQLNCLGWPGTGDTAEVVYTTEPCPGPETSGSYSLLGDCTQCPTAPAGVWEAMTTLGGVACNRDFTGGTLVTSNFWPGYDLGTANFDTLNGTTGAPHEEWGLTRLTIQ